MGDFEDEDSNKKKPHRQRLAGRKLDKKKAKSEHVQELTDRQRNPKAFAISNAVRAEKKFRRTQDLKRKKEHVPVVDRTPLEPPPILVAVVGPPKVGKSTLIKSLIKSYTRQPLTTIKGPLTLVSGKKRRITIIECNNDINCMVDIAKVADLVLLLIDASFGFEMEIFEFLNICQVHGMPKIMGVLTHLDMIKHTKKMQRTKKLLKHRFWKEVYPGAKLFYLSDMQYGLYLKHEIKNLARFISVMKFRPLIWQTSHPYILADRMEDTTPPEKIQLNPKVNRTVCLYGYMRGIPMNKNSFIHIPGCGDFAVSDLSFLPDPCPLPEQLKKRSLIEKERSIYAPFSGVGGIVYDKDAVYVELPGIQQSQSKNTSSKEVVDLLFQTKETMDTKLASSKMQFFSGSEAITASEFDQKYNDASDCANVKDDHEKDLDVINSSDDGNMSTNEHQSDDESIDEDLDVGEEKDRDSENDYMIRNNSLNTASNNYIRKKINSAIEYLEGTHREIDKMSECSSSSEEGDGSMEVDENVSLPWDRKVSDSTDSELSDDGNLPDTDLNWKNNLAEKASKAFIERQATKADLWKLVYGDHSAGLGTDENEDADEIGGLFRVVSKTQERILKEKDNEDALDSSKFQIIQMSDWTSPEVIESIRDCFVTGKWNEDEDAEELLKLDDLSDNPDEELYGDFEDLETGEKFISEKKDDSKQKELSKEKLLEKKKKLKEKFDKEYDKVEGEESHFEDLKLEASKQAELNRNQFEGLDDNIRVEIEGYRAGMYVRLEINEAPCELIDNFDSTYPLIIGGLQPGEQNIGYVKVRVKKHRWYKKILKTKDPLIISMGWRRFQTIAIYSKQEDNMRHRMLKYTPEHVACMGHFWGPLTPGGTGFLALLNAGSLENGPGFRIVATGSVVDTSQSTVITKKLKLIGTPMKIYKKTAFIKGMFNSALEVAKFEGAKIKTVSGIRGQIKKPVNKPEGVFRATFEDKILMSDIVFCRTWYKVDVPQLYISITTLLLPPLERNAWKGMRTLGTLKREKGIQNEAQPDSMYMEIQRPPKVSRPLVIPRALERELPYTYKSKGKTVNPTGQGSFMKQVRKVVVRDEHETKVADLLLKLKTSYADKQIKLKKATKERIAELKKRKQDSELRKVRKHKEIKKSIYRTLSKLEARKEKNMK